MSHIVLKSYFIITLTEGNKRKAVAIALRKCADSFRQLTHVNFNHIHAFDQYSHKQLKRNVLKFHEITQP